MADGCSSGGRWRAFGEPVAIVIAALLLLGVLDAVVLERIYKPLAAQYRVPWEFFEVSLPRVGKAWHVLWWHLVFIPGGVVLFVLLGAAARSWRLAVAGLVLFATGWEDLAYYAVQLKWLPPVLHWLDPLPAVAWTRIVLKAEHVTCVGLLLAALVGAFLAAVALWLPPFAVSWGGSGAKKSPKSKKK